MSRKSVPRDGKRRRGSAETWSHGWVVDSLGRSRRIPDLSSIGLSYLARGSGRGSADVTFRLDGEPFWRTSVTADEMAKPHWEHELVINAAVRYGQVKYGLDLLEQERPMRCRSVVRAIARLWSRQASEWRGTLCDLSNALIAEEVMSS